MGIWIEIELKSRWVDFRNICIALGYRFTNLWDCLSGFVNPIIDGKKYNICVMAKDEHYRNTIEFNIYPMSWNLKNLKETQEFIQHLTTVCNKNNQNLLTIFSDCPEFVWLHIHMFMKGALKIRHNQAILDKMSYFTMSFFQHELWKEFMRTDLHTTRRLELFSDMYRGIKNHTIMRYYDRRALGDNLTEIMARHNFEWHYGQNFGTEKPKYAPIIFSALRRNGKRTSIEARYSFNYFAKWNIEVLMRYIKIMEQTDWANVHVKGNLEALFELTCILCRHNTQLLDQSQYWDIAALGGDVGITLPKQVTLLPQLQPSLSTTFEPEVMLNGKCKKPVFTSNQTAEILAYVDGRNFPRGGIPIQTVDYLSAVTLTSNSSFLRLDGSHDMVQIHLAHLDWTPTSNTYMIHRNVLFHVCDVRGAGVDQVGENYYFVIGKKRAGGLATYIINKNNVDYSNLNAQEIMAMTGINPRDYFMPPTPPRSSRPSGLRATTSRPMSPPSESNTLTFQERMNIERVWSVKLGNEMELLPLAYRGINTLDMATQTMLAAPDLNGVYDTEEFDNYDYIEDFKVHRLHNWEKLFFNKNIHYYNAVLLGTQSAVKVLATHEVWVSSHDDYRFVETYVLEMGYKPAYFLVHKDLLSEPLGSSDWLMQNEITKLKLYCKLKQEGSLPEDPQSLPRSEDLIPIAEEEAIATRVERQSMARRMMDESTNFILRNNSSSRISVSWSQDGITLQVDDEIREINRLSDSVQLEEARGQDADAIYSTGMAGQWLVEEALPSIPPAPDSRSLGQPRF